jgi:hypothetical protein
MLAKRHLIVLVFAGGCVSGATIIGVFHETVATHTDDTSDARRVERYRAPPPEEPVDDAAEVADEPQASSEALDSPKPTDTEAPSPPEAGSSVADLIHALEVAYRQSQTAPAPQPTAAPPQTPPRQATAQDGTAALAAAPPAPKVYAPPAAAPPERTPAASAEEAPQKVASRDEPRPRDVYLGEVHQNTNVGTVNEGDVYVYPQYVPYYYPYVAFPRRTGQTPPAYGLRPMTPRPSAPNGMSQGTFKYSDSVFNYPVELVH